MNTDRPKISVITITHNSANYVRQAIESVLAQSYTNFEYIIADDCSTDNCWDIIQEYDDSRIITWQNERNLGEYPNRNKTLKKASGEYIIWIDGDDILYKNALSEYVNFLGAFPDAKAIWGVHSAFFDFIVFPYQFTPVELTKINFLSTYPVTSIGFTDSLFHRDSLIELGGFSNEYAIGDTYIKRKFSTRYSVVLVPAGRAFWRQSSTQASRKATLNLRNLKESFAIDIELLEDPHFPLNDHDYEQAKKNFNIRKIKLLVKNTILQGKLISFFKYLMEWEYSLADFKYIFMSADYSFKMNSSSEKPVFNRYNLE